MIELIILLDKYKDNVKIILNETERSMALWSQS